MDVAQKKLSNYKKENNLVDTGNVKELKIKEIQSISTRIVDAKKIIKNNRMIYYRLKLPMEM